MDQPLEEADAWKKEIARLAQLIHRRRSTMERQKTTKPPLLSEEQAHIRLSQLISNFVTMLCQGPPKSPPLSYIEANRLEQADILLDSLSKILANWPVKLLAPGENRQS